MLIEDSPLFNVVFADWNGTVISSNTYRWGDEVSVPRNPAKAADNTYTYTFVGWDKAVVNCAGDATYTATYTPSYIEYTVVFKNWDGSVIGSKTYHYGETVEVPATPEKPADQMHTYSFVGWDADVTACNGDAIYTAVFEVAYPLGDINTNKEVNSDDVIQLLLHVTMPERFPLQGGKKEE